MINVVRCRRVAAVTDPINLPFFFFVMAKRGQEGRQIHVIVSPPEPEPRVRVTVALARRFLSPRMRQQLKKKKLLSSISTFFSPGYFR